MSGMSHKIFQWNIKDFKIAHFNNKKNYGLAGAIKNHSKNEFLKFY
jgi:hypothetical protein